ncbi:hypothetical protein GCM10012275_15220 [Longimycelium tulufanense]|uniref:Uncharacterized protein n=1 Tax=Longimycelium tulufanense TaxID=907463 RepID=A0A8J3CBM7_9PSEU|nr:hypothetical protein [Longimycelium tulufanense]GGM45111.1 hypothetical protein GCM10012275_15220 [Longimycelium tulufanense]
MTYPGYQQQPQHPAPQPRVTIVKRRKDTAHTFHIIMTILTCGVWFVFIYAPLLVVRSIFKKKEKHIHY